jgi:sugar transferase (PEP-CTERM/EpsH1 system associated)
MGPYIDLAELRHIPSIVDLVDFDSQKWFDYASQAFPPRRWALQLEGHRLRTLEVALARRSRAVVLVSQPEADLFRNVTGCQNVHAVTNGVDLGSFCPLESSDPDLRRRCTFVGALDYRANVDGVLWFCQHVWPQVHARMPDRFFSIVGRRPTRAVRRLANLPGVELVGEVADVQPYYARTAFTVAPLHVARGIQNKILESLAMGKTVVGSPEALEGLDVTAGKQVLAAALPAQWVDQICHLFENPDIASRLGAAGREFVEQRHCWETCLRPFADLLRTDDRDTEQWPAPTNGCASLPSGTGHARGKSVSKVAE